MFSPGKKRYCSGCSPCRSRRRSSIIGGDVKRLGALLESEEVLSYELRDLESRRALLTDTCARRLGLGGGKITLLQIAETAEDPVTKGKLHALRAELSAMIKKQERYNKTNSELLKRKMNYIDLMLGLLTQEEHRGGGLHRTGSVDHRRRGAGLVRPKRMIRKKGSGY